MCLTLRLINDILSAETVRSLMGVVLLLPLPEFYNKPIRVSYLSTERIAQVYWLLGYGYPFALQIIHRHCHIVHLEGNASVSYLPGVIGFRLGIVHGDDFKHRIAKFNINNLFHGRHFHFLTTPDSKAKNVYIEVYGLFRIPWYNFHMVDSLEHHSNSFFATGDPVTQVYVRISTVRDHRLTFNGLSLNYL
uniref:Uncharacterized protein n=1 Tax=Kuenenia stuttgartiensis TaxID=174633 RepID=Q1Q0C8_KUEST|nr:unknown protein [Candidatus Kuenenia stuttgartiensis]